MVSCWSKLTVHCFFMLCMFSSTVGDTFFLKKEFLSYLTHIIAVFSIVHCKVYRRQSKQLQNVASFALIYLLLFKTSFMNSMQGETQNRHSSFIDSLFSIRPFLCIYKRKLVGLLPLFLVKKIILIISYNIQRIERASGSILTILQCQ